MIIQEFVNKMKEVTNSLLSFIDGENQFEENYQNLITIIQNHKFGEKIHELKSLLHIIASIVDHHKRSPTFFFKIESLLSYLKSDIKRHFSNLEIFNIFKTNKRILLYLFDEEILFLNQTIFSKFSNESFFQKFHYIEFFYAEVKPFLDEKDVDIPINHEKNRRKGENDSYICHLIRSDRINEFVDYFNQNKLNIEAEIEESIYETNIFLMNHKCRLIEYAAFFGSTQIFNFLLLNKAKLTKFVWLYSIHGRSFPLINLFKEKVIPDGESAMIESIKCFHPELTNFINDHYLNSNGQNNMACCYFGLKYHNFTYINCDFINIKLFHDACIYDYYEIVDFLLKNTKVDVNYVKI